ncbi:hypothetical protein [Candidatus Aalborgicola defluviihabitans]|uniref:hypothetical protein n=1 Tax=Candidatus Aalborgicola defluviihabitans TaxID=3386187 RepID=UPI0039B88D21
MTMTDAGLPPPLSKRATVEVLRPAGLAHGLYHFDGTDGTVAHRRYRGNPASAGRPAGPPQWQRLMLQRRPLAHRNCSVDSVTPTTLEKQCCVACSRQRTPAAATFQHAVASFTPTASSARRNRRFAPVATACRVAAEPGAGVSWFHRATDEKLLPRSVRVDILAAAGAGIALGQCLSR